MIPKLYKLVVRDRNGKVLQVHELYWATLQNMLISALEEGYSVTVSLLGHDDSGGAFVGRHE